MLEEPNGNPARSGGGSTASRRSSGGRMGVDRLPGVSAVGNDRAATPHHQVGTQGYSVARPSFRQRKRSDISSNDSI